MIYVFSKISGAFAMINMKYCVVESQAFHLHFDIIQTLNHLEYTHT